MLYCCVSAVFLLENMYCRRMSIIISTCSLAYLLITSCTNEILMWNGVMQTDSTLIEYYNALYHMIVITDWCVFSKFIPIKNQLSRVACFTQGTKNSWGGRFWCFTIFCLSTFADFTEKMLQNIEIFYRNHFSFVVCWYYHWIAMTVFLIDFDTKKVLERLVQSKRLRLRQ